MTSPNVIVCIGFVQRYGHGGDELVNLVGATPVSYTHLDVYKRQSYNNVAIKEELQLFNLNEILKDYKK